MKSKNDFAQDAIQPYKNAVLKKSLLKIVDDFNVTGKLETLYIDDMLTKISHRSSILGHYKQIKKEKLNFYNKCIRKISIAFDDSTGEKKIKLIVD